MPVGEWNWNRAEIRSSQRAETQEHNSEEALQCTDMLLGVRIVQETVGTSKCLARQDTTQNIERSCSFISSG